MERKQAFFFVQKIEFQRQKILNPDRRYANQIREKYQSDYIAVRMREIFYE